MDFGTKLWNNPSAWADNPKNVPPSWSKVFQGTNPVEHTIFSSSEPNRIDYSNGQREEIYEFIFDFPFDTTPSFTSFSLRDIEFYGAPPIITIYMIRPDNKSIRLNKLVVPGARQNENAPITRYKKTPFRLNISGEPSVAELASDFLAEEFNVKISHRELIGNIDKIIFGIPKESQSIKEFGTLNGKYRIVIIGKLSNTNDSIGGVKFALGGNSFGLMGTDALGRDLARGLIFGFPVALVIGLVTSIMATMIGTTMGIISGYIGGKTDISIQRFSDILSNIPLLPILLFLAFILGQKLWIVMATLIVFGWPGMTILIRSMVLQIRSGQLIEASTSIGSSKWHIMFRHIFPQIAPFVFAQMIFFTPAAILAEAGLSFLGLGDPSIPTWGQILDQGFRTGAVYVGYWWWVLPPGILIIFTAFTFVLIALGMEQVIDPRLRRTRK